MALLSSLIMAFTCECHEAWPKCSCARTRKHLVPHRAGNCSRQILLVQLFLCFDKCYFYDNQVRKVGEMLRLIEHNFNLVALAKGIPCETALKSSCQASHEIQTQHMLLKLVSSSRLFCHDTIFTWYFTLDHINLCSVPSTSGARLAANVSRWTRALQQSL